jgi:hypothetical protein
MALYHLAQVNIAYGIETLDHPTMSGFVSELDRINVLAEKSDGFIWRLQSDEGDATAFKIFEDEKIIINMSVWESVEALRSYVYSSDHLDILKQKKQWFEKPKSAHLALWWIPVGNVPTIEDAKARLSEIQRVGSSETAFNFVKPYPMPESVDVDCQCVY